MIKLHPELTEIGRCANELGLRAYLVGGAVRDLLLKKKHLDWDIVVEVDTSKLVRRLAKKHNAKIISHERFGTFVLELPGGKHIDFATARRETYPKPGALPVVTFSTLKDDLFRRDFTINAMAMTLDGGKPGQIIDYYGSMNDLKKKSLRILHKKSFCDDPTRILRLGRFASRGFKIEKNTLKLALSCKKFLSLVSIERKREELLAILKEKDPLAALKLLKKWDILPSILPDVELTPSTRKLKKLPSLVLRLNHLIQGFSKAQRKRFYNKIKLPRTLTKEIEKIHHPVKFNPILSGHDLIKHGYAPGPIFKTILDSLAKKSFTARQNALRYVFDNFPKKR